MYNIKVPHSGDNTHTHAQSITLHNFNATNSIVIIHTIDKLIVIFPFIFVLLCYVKHGHMIEKIQMLR